MGTGWRKSFMDLAKYTAHFSAKYLILSQCAKY